MADFVPTTVAAGAFQGTQYALPVDPNMQILVYRKDLFEQKGLKPPATWDELLAAAKAFHDPAKEQYGIAVTAQQRHPDLPLHAPVDVVAGRGAGRRPTAAAASTRRPAGRARRSSWSS